MRRTLVLLLLLALVGCAVAAGLAWRELHRPYRGFAEPGIDLEVAAGTPAALILARLEERGVVRSALLARLYLTYVLDDPPLKAGEYRFEEAQSVPQVLDRLVRGEITTHPVTLVEGLTLDETAAALADAGFGDYETFRREMKRPDRIARLDPDAEDLEGYLFPDTYRFARGTGEAAIVDTLVATFRRRFAEALRGVGRGSDEDVVPRRLVTLASVVEKEAARDDERPIIAGVFANRLRIGMPLQADPTVIYALRRRGTWDGNLRRPDLQVDSPYNTYRYPGLPPGPIASPGAASLAAAASPADVPYLYFVSRNDGSHVFATTLAEHNRNVERWQKEYWRRRWAEERRARAESSD